MDSDKLSLLVEQYYVPLYKFALSLTRREADAYDLTQHTFYIWAAKGDQLREFSKAKAWLFTTLHRLFLESRRRQARFPHCELEEVFDELPVLSPDFTDRIDSAQLLLALAKVEEIYQAAVALFYLEQCSYKEMAAILEVPIGTVKSRLARGLDQLRAVLAAEGWAGLFPVGACQPAELAAGT